jgi:hypothetical protein
VRLTQGRVGTLRRTSWRHYQDPGRSYMSLPRYLRGYCGRIAAAAERLVMVSLECRPALEVIDYGRHRDVLLYVDPPYLAGTRTSVNYRHEVAAEADHRELAAALHAARPSVTNSVATAHISRAASKWTRRPLCPEASSAPCGPALFAYLTCADRVPAFPGDPGGCHSVSHSAALHRSRPSAFRMRGSKGAIYRYRIP